MYILLLIDDVVHNCFVKLGKNFVAQVIVSALFSSHG